MYRLAVLGKKSGDSRNRRKNSYTNYENNITQIPLDNSKHTAKYKDRTRRPMS